MSMPLAQALRVCRLHLLALQGALVAAHLPVSAQDLHHADTYRIQALDQAILCYLKLQDTLGKQVLCCFVMETLGEPLEDQPMPDLLERLGFLDANRWMAARRLRNQLTHGYPEDPERQAAMPRQSCPLPAMNLPPCCDASRPAPKPRPHGLPPFQHPHANHDRHRLSLSPRAR